MPKLIKRFPSRQPIDQIVKEVEEVATKPIEHKKPLDYTKVISTGSTLLDLAISGTRRRGGGIPGGILVEIFGPSGWGKTTLLSELCSSAQSKGGNAIIGDAEHRMTPEFIQYMGLRVTEDNLSYPGSVDDIENLIFNTPETGNGIIDITGVDSIASLVSSAEKEEETGRSKKDKRGGAKSKDLHSLCRRAKGEIAKSNRIVAFTNQIQDVQDSSYGTREKTPGGHAIPFYSSLRLRAGPAGEGSKIIKKVTINNMEFTKIIGVKSNIYVFKSSIDVPYRETDVNIMFDYGIDDIRGNLEYLKHTKRLTKFPTIDKEWQSLERAIEYIEAKKYQDQLREQVIDLWEEIEERFKTNRIPKVRW